MNIENLIGKMFVISGMDIKIIADEGGRWKALNITTKETVYFNKEFFQKAIKLGKAEETTEVDDGNN